MPRRRMRPASSLYFYKYRSTNTLRNAWQVNTSAHFTSILSSRSSENSRNASLHFGTQQKWNDDVENSKCESISRICFSFSMNFIILNAIRRDSRESITAAIVSLQSKRESKEKGKKLFLRFSCSSFRDFSKEKGTKFEVREVTWLNYYAGTVIDKSTPASVMLQSICLFHRLIFSTKYTPHIDIIRSRGELHELGWKVARWLITCAGNWLRTITSDRSVHNKSLSSFWTRRYDITVDRNY